MKDYDYYLFDFDGTIMDTQHSIKKSVMYALNSFGIECTDDNVLNGFIGPPLFWSFKHFFNVSDEQADELTVKYRECYHNGAFLECNVFDGVKDVFEELRRRGKKIAVASSKPSYFIEEISKHFNIYDFYDFISGESFDNRESSKKELIEKALDFLGCTDKSRALMVGDRHLDIEGAIAASVDSAGAVFGFGTEEELEKAGATYLIYNARELL